MRATELVEQLESRINEFGDGEVVLPDMLENWFYPIGQIELDLSTNRYKLLPEE